MNVYDILEESCVVIIDQKKKEQILLQLQQEKKIYHCKFFSIEEVLEAWCGHYDIDTIYSIWKEGACDSLLEAELCIKQFSILEDQTYHNKKLDHLVSLKKKMQMNGTFSPDLLLLSFFKNQKVYMIHRPYTKLEQKFISFLKENHDVVFLEDQKVGNYCYGVYETIEEEIAAVAEQILHLLEDGVAVDHIKVWLPNAEYRTSIDRIFHLFQIPCDLIEEQVLQAYPLVKRYLEKTGDAQKRLESLYEIYDQTSFLHHCLLEQLTNFYHKTLPFPEDQDLLIQYLCQHTKFRLPRKMGAVHEIDTLSEANENDIVFGLGISLGYAPRTMKDDDYLSDYEKQFTLLETSVEKNQYLKETLLADFLSVSNLHLSYARKGMTREYAESAIISILENKVHLKRQNETYHYTSLLYNQYLLGHLKDQYRKYQETSKQFALLSQRVPSVDETFDHRYQKIPVDQLHKFLDDHLSLSYSSLQTFYQCQFRYYLNHILKLYDDQEESTSVIVGKIVHEVLCHVFEQNLDDYDDVIQDAIDHYCKEDRNQRDLFYQKKYDVEIRQLIEIIKKQLHQSQFQKTMFEVEYTLSFDRVIPVKLKGYIDNVMTLSLENDTYVMIIDYKTGNIDANFNPVVHGFQMQLLIYYYLLSQNDPHIHFGGCYWQNIMKDVLPSEEGKTYQQIKETAYQLNGYTTTKQNIVSLIDTNLDHSYIKSMRLKNDGSFYHYTKVLSDRSFAVLLDLVKGHIEHAMDEILNANFKINPKRIGMESNEEMTGCRYCRYRDICYRKHEDIVSLKEYKNLEFIEGEKDEMDRRTVSSNI